MDINLMPACDIIGCNEKVLKDIDYCEMVRIVKDIQRNAIEVAVQRCSEKAVADYETVDNYVGLIIEQTVETEKTDPIKVYVINTTILDCKQKLFEENNL